MQSQNAARNICQNFKVTSWHGIELEPEMEPRISRYCDEIASSRPMRMFQGRAHSSCERLLTRKFRLQASMTAETMITTDNVLNVVPRSSTGGRDFRARGTETPD